MVLAPGSRFRIKGRIASSATIHFGLTLYHPQGGFAGKYVASQKVEVTQAKREFTCEIGLQDFQPKGQSTPQKPNGYELKDCWCLTLNEDLGLSLISVELIPGDLQGEGNRP